VNDENVVDLAARRCPRGQAEARPMVIEVPPGRQVTFTMKNGTSYTFHGEGRVYAGERYLCSARNAPPSKFVA